VRLWKRELQVLAAELAIAITVGHLPPGTSKWNRIEHRLFAFITQNWRGKPLVSHQVCAHPTDSHAQPSPGILLRTLPSGSIH
jgi:hypothetical protein